MPQIKTCRNWFCGHTEEVPDGGWPLYCRCGYAYRDVHDKGVRVGPGGKYWPGLGDVIAVAATWLGFKQKPGCGCQARQKAMNRWSQKWILWLRERWLWVKFYFKPN